MSVSSSSEHPAAPAARTAPDGEHQRRERAPGPRHRTQFPHAIRARYAQPCVVRVTLRLRRPRSGTPGFRAFITMSRTSLVCAAFVALVFPRVVQRLRPGRGRHLRRGGHRRIGRQHRRIDGDGRRNRHRRRRHRRRHDRRGGGAGTGGAAGSGGPRRHRAAAAGRAGTGGSVSTGGSGGAARAGRRHGGRGWHRRDRRRERGCRRPRAGPAAARVAGRAAGAARPAEGGGGSGGAAACTPHRRLHDLAGRQGSRRTSAGSRPTTSRAHTNDTYGGAGYSLVFTWFGALRSRS